MNKKISFILFFLYFGGPAFAEDSAVAKNNFRYHGVISGVNSINNLYHLPITGELLNNSENNLADLRIFDQKGDQVPSELIEEIIPAEKQIDYPVIIESFRPEKNFAEMVFRIDTKNKVEINKIFLKTTNQDFNYQLKIYGSDDGQNWQFKGEEQIYDFSSRIDFRKTEINFPRSENRYYKIIISAVSDNKSSAKLKIDYQDLHLQLNEDSPQELKITSLSAALLPEQKEQISYDSHDLGNLTQEKDQDKSTIVVEASLPANLIEFSLKDPYFSRTVAVYFSEYRDKEYQLLTNEQIYRINLGKNIVEKTSISLNTGKHNFYKFVFSNFDNQPLKIDKIKINWIKKNLYFLPISLEKPYELFIGNKNVGKAVYDLNTVINSDNWYRQKSEKTKLERLERTENFSESFGSFSPEKGKKFLLPIVFIVVIALSGLLYQIVGETKNKKTPTV